MIRVLVAENRAELRCALVRLLSAMGYEAVLVDNAGEALAILEGHRGPALALLDCDMPELRSLGAPAPQCKPPDAVATYLLVVRSRKQKPLSIHLLRASNDSSFSLVPAARRANAPAEVEVASG